MPALGPHLLASYSRLVEHLASKERVLLLTTSNRYREHVWDVPKTTQLARRIAQRLLRGRTRATLLDVAALQIHACEGNISGSRGNNCGVHAAKLLDKRKNPTGHHRCWASINNRDDELYKVSRELFRCSARRRWSFSSPSDGGRRTACTSACSSGSRSSDSSRPRNSVTRTSPGFMPQKAARLSPAVTDDPSATGASVSSVPMYIGTLGQILL